MFTRTPQPGLWFIAGSFAQCRIYSKYLGLQIKACELGLLPKTMDAPQTHERTAPASNPLKVYSATIPCKSQRQAKMMTAGNRRRCSPPSEKIRCAASGSNSCR